LVFAPIANLSIAQLHYDNAVISGLHLEGVFPETDLAFLVENKYAAAKFAGNEQPMGRQAKGN
jgi:hypothetical protein